MSMATDRFGSGFGNGFAARGGLSNRPNPANPYTGGGSGIPDPTSASSSPSPSASGSQPGGIPPTDLPGAGIQTFARGGVVKKTKGYDDGGEIPDPGGAIPTDPDDPGAFDDTNQDPSSQSQSNGADGDINSALSAVMDTLQYGRAKAGLGGGSSSQQGGLQTAANVIPIKPAGPGGDQTNPNPFPTKTPAIPFGRQGSPATAQDTSDDSTQSFDDGGSVGVDDEADAGDMPPGAIPTDQTDADQAEAPQQATTPATASPAQGGGSTPPSLVSYVSGSDGDQAALAKAQQQVSQGGKVPPDVANVLAVASAPDQDTQWGILQALRQKYDAFKSFAGAALSGTPQKPADIGAAAKAASQAYQNLPDGQTVNFTPSQAGVTATVKSAAGKGQGTTFGLTPEQFNDFLRGKGGQFDNLMDNGVVKSLTETAQGQGRPINSTRVKGQSLQAAQAASGQPTAAPPAAQTAINTSQAQAGTQAPGSVPSGGTQTAPVGAMRLPGNPQGGVQFPQPTPKNLRANTSGEPQTVQMQDGSTKQVGQIVKQGQNTYQVAADGTYKPANAGNQSTFSGPDQNHPGRGGIDKNYDADDVAAANEMFPNDNQRPQRAAYLQEQSQAKATNQNKIDVANTMNQGRANVAKIRVEGLSDVQRQKLQGTIAQISQKAQSESVKNAAVLVGHALQNVPLGKPLDTRTQALMDMVMEHGQSALAGQTQTAAPAAKPTGGTAVPPAAAAYLKANPNMRSQFEAKYGVGSAASVLGQ